MQRARLLLGGLLFSLATCLLTTTAPTARGDEPYIQSIGNSSGFREHRRGKWSYINPIVRNPRTTSAKLEIVAFFAEEQNQQTAKRIEVPAGSTLTTSLPIWVPLSLKKNPTLQLGLYDVSDGERNLILKEGKRSYDTAIALRGGLPSDEQRYHSTARIADMDDSSSNESVDEMISAMRIYFQQNGRVGTSLSHFLPDSSRAFDSIDQILVDNNRLKHDAGGILAVRRWLAAGGDVWIMLDQVDEETVGQLLGDQLPYQLIDRTSLTSVQLTDPNRDESAGEFPVRNFEDPIELARVIVHSADVLFTVDDWPAAFRMNVGKGRVYFTTLGARVWMRKRDRTEPVPDERLGLTTYTVTDPLEEIGYEMIIEGNQRGAQSDDEVQAELINQIGYSILGRGSVIAILGSYTFLLIGTGAMLLRFHRLDMLFFLGPMWALLTAGTFLLIGLQNKNAVPPSVAMFQEVNMLPGASEYRVDGVAVVYSPEKTGDELIGSNDGVLEPLTAKSSDKLQRWVWMENGSWKKEAGSLTQGIEAFRLGSNLPASVTPLARLQFSESGMQGVLKIGDEVSNIRDMVLANSNGRFMAMRPLGEKQGTNYPLQTGQPLPPGAFIDTALMSDVQRWHQANYVALFPLDQPKFWVPEPTLYGWTDVLPVDIRFPQSYQFRGGALVKLPVRLVPSEPGDDVTVPATFIELENIKNRNGAISPVYSSATRTWNGSVSPNSLTRLRFQLPTQVLPIQLNQATLSIENIRAPFRDVTFRIGNDNLLLEEKSEPSGRMQWRLTQPEQIELDENGGLIFEIEIDVKPEFFEEQEKLPRDERTELPRDQLDDIRLEITGKVQ